MSMAADPPLHPLGSRARILLSGIFGPYARNDEYGSRARNLMELYHNQITREQGPFSLRVFYRTYGLILIRENVKAPCTVLDFPSLRRFERELVRNRYDIVGIGSAVPNIVKVKLMCRLVRQHLPGAIIVVGGPIAFLPGLEKRIEVDHVVKGEGVRWFRKFLGEDEDAPVSQPVMLATRGTRIMGVPVPLKSSAGIIMTLGCPKGCDFCYTSGAFGQRYVNFIHSGTRLFLTMCKMERDLGVGSFGIFDENFLLHKREVLRLIELMERYDKSWTLDCFTSADAISSYSIDQLVSLGLKQVWIGLEGEGCPYTKLHGIDTRRLIRNMQANGINIIGSTIIGMEHHTPRTIDDVINWAVDQAPNFHQFMLMLALPGSKLYDRFAAEGKLLPETECPVHLWHGQERLNYRHEHIPPGDEEEMLTRAFKRDFEVNGPSIIRYIACELAGYARYNNHPSLRIARRYRRKRLVMQLVFPGMAWGARFWYQRRGDVRMVKHTTTLIGRFRRELGLATMMLPPFIGLLLLCTMTWEAWRLARGWTYEPRTNYWNHHRGK